MRFDGKVAIITGAGGGLGRAYALELARRGAKLVVNDLGGSTHGSGKSSAAADQVVQEIKAAGGEAVANYDSVEDGAHIVQSALDHFGRVDIVINNAGILRDKTFHNMTPELLEPVIQVHLLGAFYVTQPAWLIMREKGYGRVVNTSSNSGILGNFGQSNYGSAKMGLVGFTRVLANEGRKYNIKANAIAPIAATRMTEDILPPEVLKNLTPEYVAPVVGYLCTEEVPDSASVFIVGGGKVQRTALFQNEGVTFTSPPSVSDIAARWSEIDDLSAAKQATFSLQ